MAQLDHRAVDQLRGSIWVYRIVGGAAIGSCWLLYVTALFGINLFKRNEPVQPWMVQSFLIAASVSTALAPLIVWRLTRQARDLITRGIRVPARILQVSGMGGEGKTPVTFAYVAEGVEHTLKRDIDVETVVLFEQETVVGVVYDPRNPRCAQLIEHELPTPPQLSFKQTVVEGIKEPVVEYFRWGVLSAVWISHAVLFFWILGRFDLDHDNYERFGVPLILGAVGLTILEWQLWDYLRGKSRDWRLKVSNRNLRIMGTVLVIASAGWTYSCIDDVHKSNAYRKQAELEKQKWKEDLRQGAAAMESYQKLKQTLSTRPTGKRLPASPSTNR